MTANPNRRDFLKSAAVSSAALALAPTLVRAADSATSGNAATLPKRPYKPGVELSIIGFPGLMLNRIPDQDKCNRIVAEAFEQGCNYYDVAPAYGKAQDRLGPALAPYRDKVFLACKTQGRDAERCKTEMARSFELLKTDHFDLYQLHVLRYADKDVDACFAKGGAMETVLQAKKDGRIRFIGFSAHTMEAALAAMNRFDFDSVMFPLNFASFSKGEFGSPILELALKKNISRISIKAIVKQEWPQGADKGKWKHMWYEPLEGKDAELAVRWTLSKPITAAIPGGDENLFRTMMEIGRNFKPIAPEDDQHLMALAQQLNPLFRKGKVTG